MDDVKIGSQSIFSFLRYLPSKTKDTGSKVKMNTNATHNSSTLPVKFLEQLQIQFAAKFTCQV